MVLYKWRRDEIEKLIACIEQNVCIYNTKCPEYLNRAKKAQAYNIVLEELQEKNSAITLEEIKRKWKNLRTQYMHELRCINYSIKSGAAPEDIYVPKLWCFDQLNFLQAHSELREVKSKAEVIIDDYEFHTLSDSQNDCSNEEPIKKIKKKSSEFTEFRNELDNLKTILSKRKKISKPYDWLGDLVVSEMQKISPEDRADAAWDVQCLMRKLTTQSLRKRQLSPASSSSSKALE